MMREDFIAAGNEESKEFGEIGNAGVRFERYADFAHRFLELHNRFLSYLNREKKMRSMIQILSHRRISDTTSIGLYRTINKKD
jgi:hypothetical protein